jgi:hypothetical protein
VNLKTKSADQLIKLAKRGGGMNMTKAALYELAERIESDKCRSCIPKKKLRLAGLIPKL